MIWKLKILPLFGSICFSRICFWHSQAVIFNIYPANMFIK